MRITFTQLLLAFLFVCTTYGRGAKAQEILEKRVSLTVDHVEMKAALHRIQQLTNVKFVYSSKMIDASRRISFSADQEKLSDLLDKIIKPLHVSYKVIDDHVLLYQEATDPASDATNPASTEIFPLSGIYNKEITGTVTNQKGEPLVGVSVVITGHSQGAVTNTEGKFRISVPDSGETVLEVSYVGFETQTISIGGRTQFSIVLKEQVAGLADIVVVGYGTARKKDITGSVSNISASEINDIPVGGADQIMQGKAAGVAITQNTGAPGDGVSVRIRGIGTINDNDPLYVIDGIPAAGGINEISPNDIESISVLKDASSASIYGARASNGVVLITTKKGKSGKPRLSLNAYTGVQARGHLINMANTKQYVNAYNTAATNDGGTRPLIPLSMLDTLPNVNWQKEVLKPAPMTNVQMSISGGNDNTRYIISASYFTQKGMIENSSNDRLNLHTNIESTLSKIFKVGTNLTLSYNKTRQVGSSGDGYSSGAGAGNPGPSVVRYALFRSPASPVYENGQFVDIPNPSAFFGDGLNPVGLAANTDRNFYNYTLLGDAYLEITPIEHLKIRSDIGTNTILTEYKQFFPTWGGGGYGPQGRLQNSPNELSQYFMNNFNYNWTNTATYDWIKDKSAVNILVGTEIIYNDTRLLSASTTGFNSQAPQFQYLSNGTSVMPNVGGNESNNALSSVFGRVNYQYAGRYLATFNVRRDGSSKLDPTDRWGDFYSGSVGWRIDKENFMANVKAVSTLKLRGSLGQLGNQNIPNYGYASLIGSTGYYPFGGTATPTYTIYAKGNSNIKWETSTIGDVGLDLGLFHDAFTLTADYYRKVTSNLLVNPPDPSSAGSASSAYQNDGSILNRGFEFQADYKGRINRDWSYNIGGNISTVFNKVISLVNNQPIPAGRIDNNVFATSTAVGHPIGAFYLLQQEGIFQTPEEVFTHAYQGPGIRPGDVKFKDVNGDGVIDQNDRVYAGSPIPKITYAFTGSLSFKQFDLVAFFQGVSGNKIYNQVNTDIEGFYRPFNVTERVATESWSGPGTSNQFPLLSWNDATNNKQASTRFLESGSYLRLKNLQVGYTLGNSAITRLKISSVRVFVSAQNVFTITKYTGQDPEMTVSADAAGDGVKATGIDWGTYPSARTFTAGINLNF